MGNFEIIHGLCRFNVKGLILVLMIAAAGKKITNLQRLLSSRATRAEY
jgi:hypothetical protein